MKKPTTVCYFFLSILFMIVILTPVRAANSKPVLSNSDVLNTPPSKEMLQVAKMRWFASLSTEQYSKLRGKKLNLMERWSFHLSQNRMKKMLKHYDYGEISTLQKISWLLKGLLLGPIAIALAYIFLRDEERELIKWTWFGFAALAVTAGIILLTL